MASSNTNESHNGDSEDICFYYHEHSSPSRKVLIALLEKNVVFRQVKIDLIKRQQHERWYLEKINPRGEVPVLKHGNIITVESTAIIKYIDQNLGSRSAQFYPSPDETFNKVAYFVKLLDTIPTFPLTYGAVAFHTEHVTSILRWPYCDETLRETFREMIMNVSSNLKSTSDEAADIPAGKILAEKANAFDKHIKPMFEDLEKYEAFLSKIEATLDEIETELSKDDRLGPWLCGANFTAADISLTCLLLRLYQVGLDERLWKGGIRPNISVYTEMAFNRNSVKVATEWNNHTNEYLVIKSSSPENDSDQLQAAHWGMMAVVTLGALYIYRKIRRA